MPKYEGILSIISNQSCLNNDLLLMTGHTDPAQAMFAATQFLVKVRGLFSGQLIEVVGIRGTIETVSIIVISDAGPSSGDVDGAVAGARPKARVAKRKKKAEKPKKDAGRG